MPAKTYATSHPNIVVRAMEAFRELNQLSVERHCNLMGINPRTYEAWVAGKRNPELDRLRWVAVMHTATGSIIGVLQDLRQYEHPPTKRKRWTAVVLGRGWNLPEAGDGASPFDAIVNSAQKVAKIRPGTPNSEFRVVFVPDLEQRWRVS